MNPVDPERTRFLIPRAVLDRTVTLLVESGAGGFEASVLWVGHAGDGNLAEITRVCRPEQVAYATEAGLSVELTEQGLTDLIRGLGPDEIVLARLHTHGNDDTDHSEIDDRNLVVAHPGAVSIVVPWFAQFGVDLVRCGVHVLSDTHQWCRLSVAETKRRFEIR